MKQRPVGPSPRQLEHLASVSKAQAGLNVALQQAKRDAARLQSDDDSLAEKHDLERLWWNRHGRWILWAGALALALLAISYFAVLFVGFSEGVAPGTARLGPSSVRRSADPLYFWFAFCFNLVFALLILALALKCAVAARRFRAVNGRADG